MKGRIGVGYILGDFGRGLFRELSGFQAVLTFVVFFVLPMCFGLISFLVDIELSAAQISSLISVYSIFSALLFGAQISAFSIFKSMGEEQESLAKKKDEDPVLVASVEASAKRKIENLRLAFQDINANISYLIMLSVFLLTVLIGFSIFGALSSIISSVVISLTAHLVLVLAMVVRQCHLVFAAAYAG